MDHQILAYSSIEIDLIFLVGLTPARGYSSNGICCGVDICKKLMPGARI